MTDAATEAKAAEDVATIHRLAAQAANSWAATFPVVKPGNAAPLIVWVRQMAAVLQAARRELGDAGQHPVVIGIYMRAFVAIVSPLIVGRLGEARATRLLRSLGIVDDATSVPPTIK